jgi:cytoskeletal protein CcmA (bactofilin family)
MFNRQDKPLGAAPQGPATPYTPSASPYEPAPQNQAAPTAAASAAAAAKRPAKAASVISSDIVIEGALTGEGELHIDGLVRGDVRVGKLSVGDGGQIEGSAFAEQVDVRGRIIGAVTARQIRLFATAHVDGDLTHEQLAIESGAFFQGRSLKFQRPIEPKVPLKSEKANADRIPAAPAAVPSADRPAAETLFEPSADVVKLSAGGTK